MFGVLNIYKPKGLTSHDVVGIIRKILKIKQVGHAGTLDPFAEGVLPVCVGKATRLIEYFDGDKEYLAEVKFGVATSTYDIEGKITELSDKVVSFLELEEKLNLFRGEIEQVPPIYSAIKVDGKKLYQYARNGEKISIEPRKVTIYKAELKNFDEKNQVAEILIKCSKGTYIRSIANDFGHAIGSCAYLSKLTRIQAGKFKVENSIRLPIEIQGTQMPEYSKKYDINEGAEEFLKASLQSPLNALSLPVLDINFNEYEKVLHGNSISLKSEVLKIGDFLILVYNNKVIAVGQSSGVEVKIKKVFV